MTEQWKPAPDHVGYYEVSDHGRVRSLPRRVQRSDGVWQPVKGRIMKSQIGYGGCPTVILRKGGSYRQRSIPALVMELFGPPRPFPTAIVRVLDKGAEITPGNLVWGSHTTSPHGRQAA